MVQGTRTKTVILETGSRILLVILALGAGLYFFPDPIYGFLINTLGYQNPSGFFGFSVTDSILAWFIASSILVGIFLGGIGKKIDYIFILLFFLVSSYEFFSAENMTSLVYSGLVGATLFGNAIGYVLKLLRLKYF